MTIICLKRWKIHVSVWRWHVSIRRGGICMCDIIAILGHNRWWKRWLSKIGITL